MQQGYAVLPLFFKFPLKYSIRKIQQNQKGLHWNEPADQLLVCADDVNVLGRKNVNTIRKNIDAVLVINKELCLEVNEENTKYTEHDL